MDRSCDGGHKFSNREIYLCTIRIWSERVGQDAVSFHIADNGAGIPEEIQPSLFDPFFTTKAVGKGTGL